MCMTDMVLGAGGWAKWTKTLLRGASLLCRETRNRQMTSGEVNRATFDGDDCSAKKKKKKKSGKRDSEVGEGVSRLKESN